MANSSETEEQVEVVEVGEAECPFRAYVELSDAYDRRESALTGLAQNQPLRVPTTT